MYDWGTVLWIILIILIIIGLIVLFAGGWTGTKCVSVKKDEMVGELIPGELAGTVAPVSGAVNCDWIKWFKKDTWTSLFGVLGLTSLIPGLGAGYASLLTAPSVDLTQYTGDWYEIQSLPSFFEAGCVDSRASYQTLPDGRIQITNSCVRNGKVETVTGTATVVPDSNNSKLKVKFDGMPFTGDYWILDVDPTYQWALVGTPDRKYLWILSRNPTLDTETLDKVKGTAASKGFDVTRLRADI